ncbi:hypothetical protein AAC387_Pa05g2227 [Persea americana]
MEFQFLTSPLMATCSSLLLFKTLLLLLLSFTSVLADFSILDLDFNGQDYSPPPPPLSPLPPPSPSPPPPPPHSPSTPPPPPPPSPDPPPLSCQDLNGTGSFNDSCSLDTSLDLHGDVYMKGTGRVDVLSGVSLICAVPGCSIIVNISGDFTLGENASVIAGTFAAVADDITLHGSSLINTTALAGVPPDESSGTPRIGSGGGGHGGRGAACSMNDQRLSGEVWGGDTYAWSSLSVPVSYGSKGGTVSDGEDNGGKGGGRVWIEAMNELEINGTVLADGGDGGVLGGGGSGGSIYIKALKMRGNGKISASGGNGLGGGGGGRIGLDVFSRHDEAEILAHGGRSFGCPENFGGAGTLFESVLRSLIVSNHNLTTQTDTVFLEFPNPPLWTNIFVINHAKVSLLLLWSRVQVQGQVSVLSGGVLIFGPSYYPFSEFELNAEELLMSDSTIKVHGALRMSVKILLMWNSKLLIDSGGDEIVATSLLEASNLLVLKESSIIHSESYLGIHGQGLLNLSGRGDLIEAQRVILSLFYGINIGPGSILRAPLENATSSAMTSMLYCELEDCPVELLNPPEDCSVNTSLSFTVQICRVEDIDIAGLIQGSVVHFHRARTVIIHSLGTITASGLGCRGGVGRGKVSSSGLSGGGGHGGKGGDGYYEGSSIEGGVAYGNADLPCELGSGSGNDSIVGSTAGGGIIVMGSMVHTLSSLSVYGSLRADGEVYKQDYGLAGGLHGGVGGGSGGTILLFLHRLTIGDTSVLSSVGGNGSHYGGGGGGGGRIHFDWFDIPTGDEYLPIAMVKGRIRVSGGIGRDYGHAGENGTLTGKGCPRGLYGVFCEECPAGTFKNVSGSDGALCHQCPAYELPYRAIYINVRGGVAETPCPYKCISDRYRMPHCYTALEELTYTFGGPWLFGLLLSVLLVLLASVLSVARMKFICTDDLPVPAPTRHGSQNNHSFPFLESLNEILETNRAEESRSHVHRMYFMGPNTFSEPWHLPHSPPDQVTEIVYEDAFNRFVDEINALSGYQWWEGSVHSILILVAFPLAWSWQQWRRRKKLQRLREFVRSEYDHSCLRSCRSRALYEGLKIAATPDLMLAYLDFFLGGDEKRPDLPPQLHQRFPMCLIFGGDGSYMAPFSLHSDNVLTSLMSQSVPPTIWHRLVAGLNAQLRLVRRGDLRISFIPILRWLESHANPTLSMYGVWVDLAWFQAIGFGYCQFGLVVYAVEAAMPFEGAVGIPTTERLSRDNPSCHLRINENIVTHKRICGGILDAYSLRILEKRNIFYPLMLIIHNTKPIGHQDLVGLVISVLLLGDFSLVLLTFLLLYSISLGDFILVLTILPLGLLSPFPAGINALFSHGPQRSAGLARLYALWNITSLINVVVSFICGFIYYKGQLSPRHPDFEPLNFSIDESGWWMFPTALVLCKCVQTRLIGWHVANLEIQDRSLYSGDPKLFWQS